MKTSGSSFELIMEELLKQQHILEELEAENRELQRQLADLRAGRGIFVDILGQRFALRGDTAVASQEDAWTRQADPSLQETSMITNRDEAAMPSIPETPVPELDELVEEVPASEDTSPSTPSASPIYLEEMLLDEFVSATTSQMAVWSGPVTKSAVIDEEEKAALRRELMGSFLLE